MQIIGSTGEPNISGSHTVPSDVLSQSQDGISIAVCLATAGFTLAFLLASKGAGTDTEGTLLVAARGHPERLRNEGAFAPLCGVVPIRASSGKTQRYRLNRGGDREANRARYLIATGRLAWNARTRTYAAKRTREDKSMPEIIRCLGRYISGEIYHAHTAPAA